MPDRFSNCWCCCYELGLYSLPQYTLERATGDTEFKNRLHRVCHQSRYLQIAMDDGLKLTINRDVCHGDDGELVGLYDPSGTIIHDRPSLI